MTKDREFVVHMMRATLRGLEHFGANYMGDLSEQEARAFHQITDDVATWLSNVKQEEVA